MSIFNKLPAQLQNAMLANGRLRETDMETYLQRLQEVMYDWKGIMTLRPRKSTKVAELATQTRETIQAVGW